MFKQTHKLLLIISIVCFVSITRADIYKCYDANDRVHYSGKPCGKKSQAVELEPLNISPGTKKLDSNTDNVKYSDRLDLLICSGNQGTILPIKLCQETSGADCRFHPGYLIGVVKDIDALITDISDSQIDLIKKYSVIGTEVWEFATPSSEWNVGTGARGYVVLKNGAAIYFVAVLYQGFPNKQPSGEARHLPLKGRDSLLSHIFVKPIVVSAVWRLELAVEMA